MLSGGNLSALNNLHGVQAHAFTDDGVCEQAPHALCLIKVPLTCRQEVSMGP